MRLDLQLVLFKENERQQACGPIGKWIEGWGQKVPDLEFDFRKYRTQVYIEKRNETKKIKRKQI